MKMHLIMENWSNYVSEGEMSKAQVKKAHGYAEKMMPSTKKQYGAKKGKKVAYATGTKMAMKEEQEIDEGMGMAEKVLHAGVLATFLAGAVDAAAHGDPTAPAVHVLDVMYELAKDMPPGQEINAVTFTKHLANKLAGQGSEED